MIKILKKKKQINMLKRTNDSLVIHETPLAEIRLDGHSLTVELDDTNEKRRKIRFHPYQAVRITTKDCVDLSSIVTPQTIIDGKYQRYLWECVDSSWIDSLEHSLADNTDNFLQKSKHFILDLGDDLLEVIAWNTEIS